MFPNPLQELIVSLSIERWPVRFRHLHILALAVEDEAG